MSTLYDDLICKKGATWKESQINPDLSYIKRNPKIKNRKLAGNSRVHGDASIEVQKKIIDIIIEVGVRYNLSFRDIAHMLLIAKVESGFNPDAAAGSTSAAGLAQCTDGFAKELIKPSISKKILGFTLDITLADDRFDAEKGAYALLVAFIKCKTLAINLAHNEHEVFIYTYHHDGWYSKKTKKEKENTDSYKISKLKITAAIANIETKLKSIKSTKFKLEENSIPKSKQPYIAITSSDKDRTKPPSAQQANDVTITHGITDANGNTAPIKTTGTAEVVLIILNKQIWNMVNKSPIVKNDIKYKVKRGDSLSKIAKQNGTTVEEIAKNNNIKNPNSVNEGQELIIETTYTQKKPDKYFVSYAFETLNIPFESMSVLCEYVKSHIILPKGSQSQKNESITIKETSKLTDKKSDQHKTNTTTTNEKKDVNIEKSKTDTKIIIDTSINNIELISDHTKKLLKQIGKEIHLNEIIITSGIRPPKKQAITMYGNIKTKGAKSQKNMYSSAGDSIVDIYTECEKAGLSKEQTIKKMEEKIIALSDKGIRVSKHCVSENQYKKLNVIDVSCTRMKESARKPFEAAVEKLVKSGVIEKFINPRSVSGEPAYHLEIPQT